MSTTLKKMDKVISYTLRLKKIHCYISQESDADEVFIKYDGKKIWPSGKYQSMKDGHYEIGFETKVKKGSVHVFEIWDYDLFTPNDLLGTIHVAADALGGPYTTDMSRKDSNTGRYAIEWEIS